MSITIKPEQLQSAIQEMLHEIPQKVDNVIDEAAAKVSKEAVKTLKATSPKRPGGGRYAKGWTTKKVGKQTVIHNKTAGFVRNLDSKNWCKACYEVVLFKGVYGADGITHIAPVEKQVIEKMTEEVEKGIDNL